ncbi:hypothetical protein T4A_7748 [Trichinella pseudospiralis]|uniref:Uncharacterized protein n=1 Tax=Trichinella pseudospiralis TaxID=6337 RepID=A0A0V1EUA3_TRIPS|nr:hypothetical protein T4A_7748 [Trichinella pseudospiralis]
MKIRGGESARQKGNEERRPIPARRQIVMGAPTIWRKKQTSLLEAVACYSNKEHYISKALFEKQNYK